MEEFSLTHVPRAEKKKADALSKLASSATNDTPCYGQYGLLGGERKKAL